MSRSKMRVLVILFLALFLLPLFIFAGDLQGKLEKFTAIGKVPAPFLNVTLDSGKAGQQVQIKTSDSDGMYYFSDCSPGEYILKVWVKGPDNKSLDFRVKISDQPLTNIAPILIHSVTIDYPKEGDDVLKGYRPIIKVKGSHFNLPDDEHLWVVGKDSRNYYFAPDRSVKVKHNGSWEAENSWLIDETVVEILAILVNEEGNKELKKWGIFNRAFSKLPRVSEIVAKRKIKVVDRPSGKDGDKNVSDGSTEKNKKDIK